MHSEGGGVSRDPESAVAYRGPILRVIYYPDSEDRAECFHVELRMTDEDLRLDDELIWKRLLKPAWACIAEQLSEPFPKARTALVRMLERGRQRAGKFYWKNKAVAQKQ